MKKILIAAALGLPLLASAQNLLVNGSFEQDLAGWTVNNGSGASYPVSTVTYAVLPGAFGEVIPADSLAANLSPDAVGTQAAYFVDDEATQTLSQTFVVDTAGSYNLGLSFYVPANGAANPGDVQFSLSYGTATESGLIGTLPVTTWRPCRADVGTGLVQLQHRLRAVGGRPVQGHPDRPCVRDRRARAGHPCPAAGRPGPGGPGRRAPPPRLNTGTAHLHLTGAPANAGGTTSEPGGDPAAARPHTLSAPFVQAPKRQHPMKKLLIAATLSLPLLASAQNLLTNGSFELGLAGWSTTQTAGTIYPVAPLTYNTSPGAFGEIVPTDNAPTLSPDVVGTQGVYFVDDLTTQTLFQSFTIPAAGLYNIGFSLYVPSNGAANAGDANFSASFTVDSLSVSVQSLPDGVWLPATGTSSFAPGTYTATFTFVTTGGASADAVIDRVYVAAVPEPGTVALLLAGLGIVSLTAARRRRD
jgi:PEP-CTERM motif